MPLTRKMLRRSTEGADIRCPADGGRGRSGLPGARGPCFQSRISAIIVTVFVLIPFLLPGTISAARLAGEEQPVTTEPAGSPPPTASPVAVSPSRVRTNPPAAAGTQPAAVNVPQKPAEAPPAKIAGAPVPRA